MPASSHLKRSIVPNNANGKCRNVAKVEGSFGIQGKAKWTMGPFKLGGGVDFGTFRGGWSWDANTGSNFYLVLTQGGQITAGVGKKGIFGDKGTFGYSRTGAVAPCAGCGVPASQALANQSFKKIDDDFVGFQSSNALVFGEDVKVGNQCD